ncbi:hypothetical protein PS689_00205 [Pseudomonas fluorescens]|nr:hypothetical protein PS689_00205 [Pseudomonas fluorescens]
MATAHYDMDYECKACKVSGLNIDFSSATWQCGSCQASIFIKIEHNGLRFTVRRLRPSFVHIGSEVRLDSFALGTFQKVLRKTMLKGGVYALTIAKHTRAEYDSSERITVLFKRGW